ncbi:unnamed protein product [Hermetia illucens]|uniref:Uncharacterized protein n=1 Tax=Hermetia illucens TaxID=343691 RepID=A0A7R8UKU2_HERIL|nr:vitelline membrane protein Vm26Ab-like [Hermetia illucens]CAD7082685.1 unnamed protein product [Hermetia illucens]
MFKLFALVVLALVSFVAAKPYGVAVSYTAPAAAAYVAAPAAYSAYTAPLAYSAPYSAAYVSPYAASYTAPLVL